MSVFIVQTIRRKLPAVHLTSRKANDKRWAQCESQHNNKNKKKERALDKKRYNSSFKAQPPLSLWTLPFDCMTTRNDDIIIIIIITKFHTQCHSRIDELEQMNFHINVFVCAHFGFCVFVVEIGIFWLKFVGWISGMWRKRLWFSIWKIQIRSGFTASGASSFWNESFEYKNIYLIFQHVEIRILLHILPTYGTHSGSLCHKSSAFSFALAFQMTNKKQCQLLLINRFDWIFDWIDCMLCCRRRKSNYPETKIPNQRNWMEHFHNRIEINWTKMKAAAPIRRTSHSN